MLSSIKYVWLRGDFETILYDAQDTPLVVQGHLQNQHKSQSHSVQTYANEEDWFGMISTVTVSCTRVVLQKHQHPAQVGVGPLSPMKELREHVHRKVSNIVLPKPIPDSCHWNHIYEAP